MTQHPKTLEPTERAQPSRCTCLNNLLPHKMQIHLSQRESMADYACTVCILLFTLMYKALLV